MVVHIGMWLERNAHFQNISDFYKLAIHVFFSALRNFHARKFATLPMIW